jgi:hypothetical protein
MCNGELQPEFEHRIMHIFSSARNSFSAIRSFSGSRRRLFAKSGLPFVSIVCSTPCKGRGVVVPSPTTPGNSARRFLTGIGAADKCATNRYGLGDPEFLPDPGPFSPPIGSKVSASRTLLVDVSTSKWCVVKKSAPKIGFETAANTKGTSVKILPLKQTDL